VDRTHGRRTALISTHTPCAVHAADRRVRQRERSLVASVPPFARFSAHSSPTWRGRMNLRTPGCRGCNASRRGSESRQRAANPGGPKRSGYCPYKGLRVEEDRGHAFRWYLRAEDRACSELSQRWAIAMATVSRRATRSRQMLQTAGRSPRRYSGPRRPYEDDATRNIGNPGMN
jgi:hypothetical protein